MSENYEMRCITHGYTHDSILDNIKPKETVDSYVISVIITYKCQGNVQSALFAICNASDTTSDDLILACKTYYA